MFYTATAVVQISHRSLRMYINCDRTDYADENTTVVADVVAGDWSYRH